MNKVIHNDYLRFGFFGSLFLAAGALAIVTGQWIFIGIPFLLLFFYSGWQHMDIVFWILLFSLPISAEYQFSSSLGTDIPDEAIMLFASCLFIFYYAANPAALDRKKSGHLLISLLLIALCWSVVTLLFSTDPMVSFKYLLAKTWYIGAFTGIPLLLFKDKRALRMAALLLASSMFIIVAITIARQGMTTFKFASVSNAVAPFFRNHVNYSAMLVCILPLFYAFYKLSTSAKWKSRLQWMMGFLVVALVFSYSRGAWLALAAGILAGWLIRKKLLLISFILLTGLITGGLFWVKSEDRYLRFANDYKNTIFHENFREHLIATYEGKDVSTAERFYRWIAGINMVGENPLTGTGPNTFYENYKPYAVPAFKTWVSNNEDHSTVHNYFLLLAVEQGIPGLIFFLVLLGAMLYYAETLYRRINDIFYKTVAFTAGIMITMIIVVNFLSDLIETDKIGSLFFLCLATLVVVDINSRRENSREGGKTES
ncbi:MAG TPA: O-antigen ligase family protein [Chitinophagaceae bacterium]|nr:O-antigen ligase family protein [Chitinophagaceae bacterium]